ncbi:hypothetical protein [Alkalimonas mucilaginosa]|uniref:Uncharacterized protein n=1 Tax=Alkalimonas mucilaginosa TaxID=3057676 RepID=A0ABU7JH56_9GAMM|nr:hypothetical protein [Alkalimonas sp. MEB004]MEE2025021.1 hypothetical protein [Alkalimonas sp. MEB004]
MQILTFNVQKTAISAKYHFLIKLLMRYFLQFQVIFQQQKGDVMMKVALLVVFTCFMGTAMASDDPCDSILDIDDWLQCISVDDQPPMQPQGPGSGGTGGKDKQTES